MEIPRDRWLRPLIIPPEGGKPIPYVRASKLAKTLDDLNQLMQWKMRKTLEGVLRRPDLLTQAAGAIANGNPDTDWPTKKNLNAIAAQALEAAGSSKGSSAGTGFHALTEAMDRGEEPQFVPEADRVRLEAYREAVAPLTALEAETFIVCDELTAAGSFDRIWGIPAGFTDSRGFVFQHDTVAIGDLKSGKSEAEYPLSTAVQESIYAHGLRYNPETGERALLHPDLDQTVGLLIHLPPKGGCEVIALDLVKGWETAQQSAIVHHRIRKFKPADIILASAS